MQRRLVCTLRCCLVLLWAAGGLLAGCAGTQSRGAASNWREQGLASWYGADFHGRRTANGERYNMYAMTAAHKTLPFGTKVAVVDQRTGRRIRVRINDRGPFVAGRIIDLSLAAARSLGSASAGVVPVTLEAVLPSSAFASPSVSEAPQKTTGSGSPAPPGPAPPSEPSEPSAPSANSQNSALATERFPRPQPLRGTFAVQVGAFAVESNARGLAARLPAPPEAVRVLRFVDGSGTWWRVRVGGYESELAAETAAAAFEEAGLSTFVVRED